MVGKVISATLACHTQFVLTLHSEKTLRAVLKKQRDKVEEIKKRTNYYSTRNLIEKYDEQSSVIPSATPIRRRSVAPSASPTPLQLSPLQRQFPQTPNGQTQGLPLQLSRASCHRLWSLQVTLSSISAIPQPIQATRKQWYDKLADAILGDDESSVSVPASRYALICQKCFAHNGLVKESQWEGARESPFMSTEFSVTTSSEYICFKCGFFNPSARSKKQLAVPRTPSPLSSDPSPIRSADHKLQSIAGPEQSPDRHSASNELQSADDSIVVGTE